MKDRLLNLIKKISVKGAVLLAVSVVVSAAMVAGIAKTYAAESWTVVLDSGADGGSSSVHQQKIFPLRLKDGKGRLAPGAKSKYVFKIKNNNSFGVKCITDVKVDFTNPSGYTDFPVNATLTRMAEDKVCITELDGKEDVRSLAKGAQTEYTLYWSWDTVTDEDDTRWGNVEDDVLVDMTITVRAEQADYKVHFDSAGGSAVPDRTLSYGDRLGSLTPSKRSGYTFLGWYDPKGNRVSEDTVLSPDGESITLTAHWRKNSSGNGGGSGSPAGITGEWILVDADKHEWNFKTTDGRLLKDGWYYIYNPYSASGRTSEWFRFGEDGILDSGWIKENDSDWYHSHTMSDGDLGALDRGWYNDDQDGKTYYLDPGSGLMRSGWQYIDGYWYYFTKQEEVPFATWGADGKNIAGFTKWVYTALGMRPYGSMYRNEMTPDGYWVDENGRWVDNGAPQGTNGLMPGTVPAAGEKGWIRADETGVTWYHAGEMNTDGTYGLNLGWYDDSQDGRTYYLDPASGVMMSGWQMIDGSWYYFTRIEEVPSPTWGTDGSNSAGFTSWVYQQDGRRPYGSMYRGEMTPDGYYVDENGRWDGRYPDGAYGQSPAQALSGKERGWIRVDAEGRTWYHAGTMNKGGTYSADLGWYDDDQDGRRYYLDPSTGIMRSGWQWIDGYRYYFTPYEEVPYPTWNTSGTNSVGFVHWVFSDNGARPYGSMYRNEMTPDGSYVDGMGRWCVDGKPVRQFETDLTGWIREDEEGRNWYHAHAMEIGNRCELDYGWYFEPLDGKWYYFDPVTGLMRTGWQVIDGYRYYFNIYEDVPYPTWGTHSFNRAEFAVWVYDEIGMRPYGSMFAAEKTPDGKYVDALGRESLNGMPLRYR